MEDSNDVQKVFQSAFFSHWCIYLSILKSIYFYNMNGSVGSWSESWSKDESRQFVIPFGFSGLVNLSMSQRR